MQDKFKRPITYLRLSVTDRCDMRCIYCLGENAAFAPKSEVLSLEELEVLCDAFLGLGIRKIRITGGEPLTRPNILTLIQALGRRLQAGALEELCLTTNGSQLARHARTLAEAGVRRVNVSLDSLDAARYARITRLGRRDQALEGIAAARSAGLQVKINMVVLRGLNEDEVAPMVFWCGERGMDLSLIEVMPMGEAGHGGDLFVPLSEVQHRLSRRYLMQPSSHDTGGPSRYWTVAATGCRVGFITPMSETFCAGCNRVRATSTGHLYTCLGREDQVDLKPLLRGGLDMPNIRQGIARAVAGKPEGHKFLTGRSITRCMAATGG